MDRLERTIGKFGLCVIDLISRGEKESVSFIENIIDSRNLVQYFKTQYELPFKFRIEDIKKLENVLQTAYDVNDWDTKFMIQNQEQDGLLLVSSILFHSLMLPE